MNTATATAAIKAATTKAARADLNDWAVNTIRENFKGSKAEAVAMIREEAARADGLSLEEYKRANRSGSAFLLSRKLRIAVYVLLATR
jgi:hypothetical protein